MQISKFLKSIGFSICICILLLFVKNEYTCKLMDNMNYGIPALIKKGSVEELYIGSSMFRQGLDINTLTEDGTDAYILSYNGNQPYLEAIILQKLVEEGVKIDRLFIDMYAYTIIEEPDLEDSKLLLEFDINGKNKVYSAISSEYSLKTWWQFYVSCNMDSIITWPVSSQVVNKQFLKGGNLQYTQGATMEEYNGVSAPAIQYELNDKQLRAIEDIAGLCSDNDIKLMFVETSKYIGVMEDATYIGIMEKYRSFLDNKGISYILADDEVLKSSYETGDFLDVLHLSSSGRQRFTNELINKIRAN